MTTPTPREASIQAARAKVQALPPAHRAQLEAEFLRAEQEAAAILHASLPTQR